MIFAAATAIADAVLMEGYALYPYRASAPKNRFRWTFGVLAPRAWSEAGGSDSWWMETQVLIAGVPERISGRLRFFQIDRRNTWDEGVLRTVNFDRTTQFAFDDLAGTITVTRECIDHTLTKLTIRIENHSSWRELAVPRERAMVGAFASTHLLLHVDGAEILSAIDPPEWAREESARCTNVGTYPVLVGNGVALAAPFILYDYPQIAPESAGDLCDATEIDELLVLRTRTMTDEEKREARATDPRAAAIVDRADALPEEWLERMHGATRDLNRGEMVPRIAIGAKVRLLAPKTRTDAQDFLYAGQIATVVEIRDDVDGTRFLGVTIDGDPAAELHQWYGRCHYYRHDEVELL
jgi:hypothetical protein